MASFKEIGRRLVLKRIHLERLKSPRCVCGADKRRGCLFCWRCWRALRWDTRRALSSAKLGRAEAVYELALAELEAKGRIEEVAG